MPLTYPGKPRQPKDGLLSAEAMEDEGDAPRYPLMGAWMCETFFPWVMPLLYGLAWAALQASIPRGRKTNTQAAELIDLAMAPYSSSLYPVLALALERQQFLADSDPPRPCFDLGLTATGGPWLCAQEHSLAGETTAARLQHLVGSDRAHRLAHCDRDKLCARLSREGAPRSARRRLVALLQTLPAKIMPIAASTQPSRYVNAISHCDCIARNLANKGTG